jgi:hypothetical protein
MKPCPVFDASGILFRATELQIAAFSGPFFAFRSLLQTSLAQIAAAANVDERRAHALRLWAASDCGAVVQPG